MHARDRDRKQTVHVDMHGKLRFAQVISPMALLMINDGWVEQIIMLELDEVLCNCESDIRHTKGREVTQVVGEGERW